MSPRQQAPRGTHGFRAPVPQGAAAGPARRLGPPASQQRLPLGSGRALLLHRRALTVTVLLVLAALAVMVVTVLTGTYEISAAGALRVLGGRGGPTDRFIVLGQRLPRATATVLVGAMLALSGAVFQSLSRNPLGSPDIVGFTTGASTGGLVVILLLGHSDMTQAAGSVPLGTLVGGLLTIALVYALSARRGIGGQWMILAGIAVGALLSAVNDYLITRADIDDALMARTWLFGSLQGADWTLVTVMAVLGMPLLALAALQAPALDLLEMGDEVAGALGLPVRRARSILLVVAVALTALVIALAGPIGFVALVAPQLARRLCRGGAYFPAVVLMGALLCVAGDTLARTMLAPFQIPVGLVTSMLGGAYLVWLLAREWKA